MEALILAGGSPVKPALLKKLCRRADRVICADSGAEAARKSGLSPNAVVGDLDSVSEETLHFFRLNGIEIIEISEQESTDLEKAVNLALKWGASDITITGITGQRSDHFLHALGLLIKYREAASMRIVDDSDVIRLLWEPVECECAPGERISLLPWGTRTVERVTTIGLEFPLRGENMTAGGLESISNRTTGDRFRIDFDSGMLLMIRPVSAVLGDE